MAVRIEPLDDRWRKEAVRLWTDHMGSPRVASRGLLHDARSLLGFVALSDGVFAAVLTYRFDDAGDCEVVTLHSAIEGAGAGSALLDAAADTARERGASRLWLITTNDNTHALRFYQRRGWRLAALHMGAVTEARATLKAEIPIRGDDGIEIRDEIELEFPLR